MLLLSKLSGDIRTAISPGHNLEQHEQPPRGHTMPDYHYRVIWSDEDSEHVGLCDEFPGLSWLEKTPEDALAGIRKMVAETVVEMIEDGEPVPASRL
ncbi:hypothetical protein [Paraburkholderia sp. RL18-085-BIA-A]|uniref:hypothetical protein n=1 Tax=Paraburkholderia sp. RL18-085-BIA-A TaxID=3031633 RepID=UPI0038B8D7F8